MLIEQQLSEEFLRNAGKSDTYLYIYLSCICFNCFDYSYSLIRCVCLFHSSTVLYQHQQHGHVLYEHLCHRDILPSKCNRNTTAAATTGTQSDNGNGNRNRDTRTTQQQNADRQQSFSIINSVNTSSINIFVAITSFPPSATETPQQQQQLQPERNPIMAGVAITKYWTTDSRDPSNYNRDNVNGEIQTRPTSATTATTTTFISKAREKASTT